MKIMEEIKPQELAVKTVKKVRGKPFKSGKDWNGNALGRPLGSRNFETDWFAFIEKVAKLNKITPDEVNEQQMMAAFKKIKDGSFPHWKEVNDRIYGKPPEKIEHSGGIKTEAELSPEVIAVLHADAKKRKTT